MGSVSRRNPVRNTEPQCHRLRVAPVLPQSAMRVGYQIAGQLVDMDASLLDARFAYHLDTANPRSDASHDAAGYPMKEVAA